MKVKPLLALSVPTIHYVIPEKEEDTHVVVNPARFDSESQSEVNGDVLVGENLVMIEMSAQASGCYIVHLQSDTMHETRKWMKMN